MGTALFLADDLELIERGKEKTVETGGK